MAFAARQILEDLLGIDIGTAAGLTSVPGAYTSYFAKDIEADVDHDMVAYQVQRSEAARGDEPSVVGREKGTVSCKIPWRGGKTSGGSNGTSPIITLAQYAGMAVNQLAGGADLVTGGGADYLEVLDASDPGWEVGDFVLVNADEGSTNDLQLRPITRVQADYTGSGKTRISVTPNWDTNPGAGDSFYAVDVLKPDPITVATYLGLDLYKGEGSTDRFKVRCLGAAISALKLGQVEAGGMPWAELQFMIDNWAASEANRSDAADSFAEAPLWLSDAFYLGSNQIHISSLEFDFGLKLVEIPGQAAQGRYGWKYLNPEPIININPMHDLQYYTDWEAKTTYAALAQRVVDQYQAWGIYIPKLQVLKAGNKETYTDGILGAGLNTKICCPGVNADSDNYPLFSVCFSGAAT